MIKTGSLICHYFMLSVLAGMIILCLLRIRHMLRDIHRTREGLCKFITCHGKERWGPPVRVKEWQRNAIRHLIAQRETLDNDIWQLKNRQNNLAEMEQEELKKVSELVLSKLQSKNAGDREKSLFIKFELIRNRAKSRDLKHRKKQKDIAVRSMEHARQHVTDCLRSYSEGENPRLPVSGYIRGLFFDIW
jgi:hypothetical protein